MIWAARPSSRRSRRRSAAAGSSRLRAAAPAAVATSSAVTSSGTAIIIVQFQASRARCRSAMVGAASSAHQSPSSGATLKSRSGSAFFRPNLSVYATL